MGVWVLVGLCVERSLEMVVGLLGILKAGGAYVPIDPFAPTASVQKIISHCQIRCLITHPPMQRQVLVLLEDSPTLLESVIGLSSISDKLRFAEGSAVGRRNIPCMSPPNFSGFWIFLIGQTKPMFIVAVIRTCIAHTT